MQYYTVKEIADLTGVTIKTLYHYHKIGLLVPCNITESGYRIYGIEELERLQQILFYRELDFSLNDIKKALENETSRIDCLTKQHEMLKARRQRMDSLISTIEQSIIFTKKGENMEKSDMFKGFNEVEWVKALKEQNEYLNHNYGYDMLKEQEIEVEKMNRSAVEAQGFTKFMIEALRSGIKASDEKVQKAVEDHIVFINDNSIDMDAKKYLNTSRFMLEDDFHRNMLENQQIGLAYYQYAAAELYAEK
ncbi:MerR family transcriptional regulator [Clostridium paridis]|uniref:MerR family transcriptional regulator n=1 Tax=Clostridium paridis TaxID=2803863 RepID=A0A937K5Y0_9CLOT|nr:MerR family transcriptional regulator [Clostridium paridis]MBL4933088.1 MerR family transcriptional regulator [Clostridium paridis]